MVTQEELEKMSPEEIAELQRKNCIFCKIIAGEVPSNKVFEDDLVASFLDINPATKGHVLVMPKEHAPILPLIPPKVFGSMFVDAKYISKGIKDALLVPNITLFIANGAVAGQQASHFLFHIIPREKGDKLNNFSLSFNPDLLSAQEELLPSLKKNLPLMMKNHFQRLGISPPGASQSSDTKNPVTQVASQPTPISPEEATKKREMILKILDENKDARDLLRKNPEEFKTLLSQNKELESIFAGVDLVTLSEKLKQIPDDSFSQEEKNDSINTSKSDNKPNTSLSSAATQYISQNNSSKKESVKSANTQKPKSEIFLGDNPIASRDKVLAYFNKKPKAKEIFIDDLERFKSLLADRKDIQEIFKDINLEKLSSRLKEIREKELQGGDAKNG